MRHASLGGCDRMAQARTTPLAAPHTRRPSPARCPTRLLPAPLLLPLLLLLLSAPGRSAAAAAAGWRVVRPQTADSAGTDDHPSIRYGHSLAAYRGGLVTTHGYYYDRARNIPVWLSDTWALNTSAHEPSLSWQRLSDHLPQSEAHRSYSSGTAPRAPCGRFGHASALVGDALLLYGGHDGGYSRTNRQDYQPGNDFDELWRFDLGRRAWSLEHPGGSGPGKRYLHSVAAVRGQFLLYGGTTDGQGDLWSYDTAARRWALLSKEVPVAAGGPGRRMGASLTPWLAGGAAGVMLYGGRAVLANGTSVVHADPCFFDLAAASWRRLLPAAAAAAAAEPEAAAPPGRLYHAAVETVLSLPLPAQRRVRVGVVAGGTLTTPGLACAADAWAFTLDCTATRISWARLPDFPAALYDTRAAVSRGSLFLFGGHLCALDHPPAPPYPYWYVNQVLQLDLAEQAEALGRALGAGGTACELQTGEAEEEAATEGGEQLGSGRRVSQEL
ncbi:Attractin-like protein 1 [Tetrabaena socialis]|uniref:Attractin-like protein 1 n=1 Tax=Tetrabaena socialis TaxID=47790 RepID=A0A2J7ZMB9_9CHLO|nr:Attractin-like protein 1 [Tetrabaena socialis]|eukprot:PNH01419.1 Attractin-like protein 1 [Tetrabaena socialis]